MDIFLCSTAYDLEDFRALIVDKFGKRHKFIHFESAAFPSRRGLHSHDQCIEAVRRSDVVIYIADKRYGGKYAGNKKEDFPAQAIKVKNREIITPSKDLSISWCELITAYKEGKYVITFARQRVLDEKETRRKNQRYHSFIPAHVDNELLFNMLDWITKQPKDNWIIPFYTAVDLLEKLDEWLNVANEVVVSPTALPAVRQTKAIAVIVEGSSDAAIIKLISQSLKLKHPVSIVVAGGKRLLFSFLATFISAYHESKGLIVVADADTTDKIQVDTQKQQLAQIIRKSTRTDTEIIFTEPTIESWFNDPKINHRHKPQDAQTMRRLIENIEENSQTVPSLGQFIMALKRFDE